MLVVVCCVRKKERGRGRRRRSKDFHQSHAARVPRALRTCVMFRDCGLCFAVLMRGMRDLRGLRSAYNAYDACAAQGCNVVLWLKPEGSQQTFIFSL